MSNGLMRWDPFHDLDEINERMGRILGAAWGTHALTLPTTDIYEEGGKLVVETALPHFKDEEVEVHVDGDRLEIRAERKAEVEDKQRTYLRRESTSASYHRAFTLPQSVDPDSADASFTDGVLKVVFDQREQAKPKKLELKSGKKDK